MIVDDEKNVLSALQRVCRGQKQWDIEIYHDPQTALKRAQTTCFDLFLADYRMPQMNGVQFLSAIKQRQPDAMRLILSGQTDREGLLSAINEAQIYHYIDKPWQDHELLAVLHQALDYHDVLLENRMLANQVRDQQKELGQRKLALEKYRIQHPDLFKVEWTADGSIILDEED
jgi:response regulator RpfG family c-di-GMP phosphodiesterase